MEQAERDVTLCKAGFPAAIESYTVFLANLMLFFYAQPGLLVSMPAENRSSA